jgi:hypothetical protein
MAYERPDDRKLALKGHPCAYGEVIGEELIEHAFWVSMPYSCMCVGTDVCGDKAFGLAVKFSYYIFGNLGSLGFSHYSPHPSTFVFRQVIHDITNLVDLASLNEYPLSKCVL